MVEDLGQVTKENINEEIWQSNEFVISYAYPVVDAALWEEFDDTATATQTVFRRINITSGSAVYALYRAKARNQPPFFGLLIRMLTEKKTYIGPVREVDTPEAKELASRLIPTIIHRIQENIIEKIALTSPPFHRELSIALEDALHELGALPEAQKKPGAPRKANNAWVREEIAKGTKREIVFAGYLERERISADDLIEVDRAEGRFRKMLSRDKKT
jgi:hypothetical protein